MATDRSAVATSYWWATTLSPELDPGFPEDFDRTPDVLVVGGGVVGVATAATCALSGVGRVALVERERLGSGTTGRSAAILAPDIVDPLDEPVVAFLRRRGYEGWRELDARVPGGLGLVSLNCYLPWDAAAAATAAHGVGVRVSHDDAAAVLPNVALPPELLLVQQARINPLTALARLSRLIPSVATEVDVHGVVVRADRIVAVETSRGRITPGAVVFATGSPPRVHGLDPRLFNAMDQAAKGHLLVTEKSDIRLDGSVAGVGTPLEDGRILLGGEVDFDDVSMTVRPEVVTRTIDAACRSIPALRYLRVEYAWACLRPVTGDRMPVVDRVPEMTNAWVSFGHFRTGILVAPAVAAATSRWIHDGDVDAGIKPLSMARPSLTG